MATVAAQIQQIYIGLLGRAADQSGLDYWTNEIDSGALTLEQLRANIVNEQPEYANGLGTMSRAQVVASLYENLFDRAPDSDGLDYWVNGGGSGVNADQLVLALVNGAVAQDTLALDNKVEVAQYYTANAGDNFSADAAEAAIANVDGSLQSVQDAKAEIDSGSVSNGQTFTLTDGIDNLSGTATDDTFIGDDTSANAGDTIDGKAGTDTLKLFNTTALGNISGIENVVINGSNGTVNVANNADVTTLTLKNTDLTDGVVGPAAAASTYTVADGQTVALEGVTDAGGTDDFLQINSAASVTSQDVTLNGVGDTAPAGNEAGFNINGAGVETLNVEATGKDSNVALRNTGNSLDTLNVSGDSAVQFSGTIPNATSITSTNTAGVTLTTNVATNTAAGLSVAMAEGDDSVTLAQGAGANALTNNTSVDLAAGDDTLSITNLNAAANIQDGASFAGGEGTDTLNIHNGAVLDATRGALFSGFETVDLANGTGTYDLSTLEANNSIDSLVVSQALVGGTTVTNLAEGADVEIGAALTGALVINQKDAGAGSPDDSLDVTVDARAGITTGGNLDINDIETVNLSVKGTGSTTTQTQTITTLTADEATKITIDASDANATIGDLVAESAVLVDASASAEDVSITTTDAFTATSGVSFKGGEGDDTINLTGADTAAAAATDLDFVVQGNGGADAITLAAAGTGVDQVVYAAQSDSTATDFDSIANFAANEDSVDLSAFGISGQADDAVLDKSAAWGAGVSLNASGDVEVTDAVAGNFFNDAGIDRGVAVASDGTDSYVFVDTDGNGDFNADGDMVIQLAGGTDTAGAVASVGDFTFA
ncbi:DUF4214 domain-containing protein [Modicisalibacter sp. 'Wilcox']|uniref:DUF4214 domain-containing protein n=1 Tax=Modicisalibacter sp. 'Wilcox' TaxID=2679914 RepID=UPI0013D2120A|nr:DUF4214 domain-containing protein [Modicisalibacter sp. 'Wilcox']